MTACHPARRGFPGAQRLAIAGDFIISVSD
jgi:hypothetical protein